jgi:hypothetical protein
VTCYSFRLAPHRFAAFRDTIAALRIAGKPIWYTEAGQHSRKGRIRSFFWRY